MTHGMISQADALVLTNKLVSSQLRGAAIVVAAGAIGSGCREAP